MYNRYVPTADGSFRRQSVGAPAPSKPRPPEHPPVPPEKPPSCETPPPPCEAPRPKCEAEHRKSAPLPIKRCAPQKRPPVPTETRKKSLLPELDSGELLVLAILLLLLKEGGEDSTTLLLAAGIYLFLT